MTTDTNVIVQGDGQESELMLQIREHVYKRFERLFGTDLTRGQERAVNRLAAAFEDIFAVIVRYQNTVDQAGRLIDAQKATISELEFQRDAIAIQLDQEIKQGRQINFDRFARDIAFANNVTSAEARILLRGLIGEDYELNEWHEDQIRDLAQEMLAWWTDESGNVYGEDEEYDG